MGSRTAARRASRRARQTDSGTRGDHTPWHWSVARLSLQRSRLPCSPCTRRGEHLARSALQSVFMTSMRTQNLEWLERVSLDRRGRPYQAPVGTLWHRCYKCPASDEFRRGYCQVYDLGKWPNRMPASEAVGALWTRLMLNVQRHWWNGPGHHQKGHATMQRRHDLAVAVAGERAGGRAGEERVGSAPVCQQVRAEFPSLGLAKFLGRLTPP